MSTSDYTVRMSTCDYTVRMSTNDYTVRMSTSDCTVRMSASDYTILYTHFNCFKWLYTGMCADLIVWTTFIFLMNLVWNVQFCCSIYDQGVLRWLFLSHCIKLFVFLAMYTLLQIISGLHTLKHRYISTMRERMVIANIYQDNIRARFIVQ